MMLLSFSLKTFKAEEKAAIVHRAAETNVSAAAKEFGVSRAAIIKWRDSAKVEKAEKKVKAKADKVKKNVKSAAKKAEKKAEAVKTRTRKAPKTEVIIQSPMGGNITPEEVLAKVGEVDQVYIRVDENKAYWVKGEESGSVDLW